MHFKKSLLAGCVTAAIASLTACGGSSSGSPAPTPSTVTGSLSSSTVGLTNDNIYLLASGFPGTYIGNGEAADGDNTNNDSMSLQVEPGTLILGNTQEALIVTRGSTVQVQGTATDPVVMTSETQFDDWAAGGAGTAGRGEWAGFALMGNARTNECGTPCDVAAEGNIGAYGGTDDADNSGTMQYLVIRHAGNDLDGNGNELNGFTLFGTGSGSTIDHIQVHKGLDDGIEHFGGADFMSHVVLTDNADDSFDWGQGYRGGAQFVVVKQAPDAADRAIEADNDGSNPNFTPVSLPVLANMTFMGDPLGDAGADGILLRRGTGANIYNTIVTGFADNCLDIDELATMQRAHNGADFTGDLTVDNTFINCTTNFKTGDQDLDNADGDNDSKTGTEQFADLGTGLPNVPDWFTNSGANNDSTTVPDLTSAGIPQNAFATAVQGAALTINIGGDFVSTDYAGAFDPSAANPNWTDGWTVGLNGNSTIWEPATGGTLAGNAPVADGTCPEGTTLVGSKTLPVAVGGGEMDLCQLERRYDSSDVK